MNDAPSNALAVFLRDHLQRLDMTADEFAVAVNISRSRAFKLKNGTATKSQPADVVQRVAAFLDITQEDFLSLLAGQVAEADVAADEREALVRQFVLRNRDLTPEQLRDVLRVAEVAAEVAKRK